METNPSLAANQSQDDDDHDSLFGSPPSSPIRGRSPSPTLALPGSSGNGNSGNGLNHSTQNVGTIALPGSHLYSELPVHPLALSLSNAPFELPLRPPAQPARPIQVTDTETPTPPWSRASSTQPVKKKKANKPAAPAPRPLPPPIHLPDPSDPPPVNFLRNQSGLLGTAGLVGGVKPAHLSKHRHTRGTTPSNPIIVEDEADQPSLGMALKSRFSTRPPVDPALLPAPSNEEIVASLIKQKNIFPVLENILKLIASGAGSNPENPWFSPPPRTGFERISHSERLERDNAPPNKKRKLARVPAGATDWDVPYPFSNGEGPQAYRSNWEKERGRQLIAQLVSLIKTAAKKAATKAYWEQQEKKAQLAAQQAATIPPLTTQNVHNHYRPVTATYGRSGVQQSPAQTQAQAGATYCTSTSLQDVLTDTSNGNPRPQSHDVYFHPGQVSSTNNPKSPQPSTPFDQLIASLLAATPEQSTVAPTQLLNGSIGSEGTNTPSELDPANIDQGLFDNWMSIFNKFPVPQDAFTSPSAPNENTPESSIIFSADGHDSSNHFFDFNTSTLSSTSEVDNTTLSSLETNPDLPSIQEMESMMSMDPDMGNPQNLFYDNTGPTPQPQPETHPLHPELPPAISPSDSLIDPTLLAISIPHNATSRTPSLMPSPGPSSSSSLGPLTPQSSHWDLGPEIYNPSDGRDQGMHDGAAVGQRSEGTWRRALWNNHITQRAATARPAGDESSLRAADLLLQLSGSGRADDGQGKGKGREIAQQWDQAGAAASVLVAAPRPVRNPTGAGRPAATKPLVKEGILKRAREQRRQLAAEIERAKVELWETTIEHGVLTQLVKDLS